VSAVFGARENAWPNVANSLRYPVRSTLHGVRFRQGSRGVELAQDGGGQPPRRTVTRRSTLEFQVVKK
jgi:hypothetical protein